jgi:hypothetical protein
LRPAIEARMDQAQESVAEIELLYRQHGAALLIFAFGHHGRTEPSPGRRASRIPDAA